MHDPVSPKVLLIDDDESFRTLLLATARAEGMELEAYPSLADLGRIGQLGEYDVVVLDYHLDAVSGLDISRYVEAFLGVTAPVIVVSGERPEVLARQPWPKCVKRFVAKNEGARAILEAARRAARGEEALDFLPFQTTEAPTTKI